MAARSAFQTTEKENDADTHFDLLNPTTEIATVGSRHQYICVYERGHAEVAAPFAGREL